MFSKPKPETTSSGDTPAKPVQPVSIATTNTTPEKERAASPVNQPVKTKPSMLSEDLVIQGNVLTEGDIQIEGTIEGDVRASGLTVGETAVIRGELAGEDVVVHGHVIGRLRGRKVRLAATAQVEGDIVHKTIAIEAGAQFEGSVQRQDDPLAEASAKRPVAFKDPKSTAAE